MSYDLKYKRYGERSILIEWPQIIDENILKNILNYKIKLKNYYSKVKLEIIITYNSILVIYNFTIDNINDEISMLKSLYSRSETQEDFFGTTWEIPVCYDEAFGFDLEHLAEEKKLSISEIIKRHSRPIYTVYFVGFLPGFLYLGGLDKSLYINRKSIPNLNIKKGAVGIGGNQTGIYPKNSPGGWHIIGNSPIDFFQIEKQNPCFAKAGDKVKFKSILREEYVSIYEEVKNNSYQIKTIS
ncbi:MAG: 5-oxoprolinase subunit PxpB [Winogradskyella sp.]|uniref:5-oxoprolinase subunit PxpB n=1 Tax=Winogradskyella sp. TaxID=1883156 RepID=UPI0017DA01FD|nr:5-oxoprolinase subunit PxpB [Winogradskyella sp.]MBT8245756.1 5-oxoprolinase subunit PxpB [Winogradskyella sp.]NNK21887.1 5-oxoprolinase subunit PxpB [Winogradskyella sp.]